MLNENAQKWVEALRSGEYQQTVGRLHRVEASSVYPAGWCCLGVACDVFDKANPGVMERNTAQDVEWFDVYEAAGLPVKVMQWLGVADAMGSYDGNALYAHNDQDRLSFAEIADVIESEPAGLFKPAAALVASV